MNKLNDIPLARRVSLTLSTAFAALFTSPALFVGCSVALHAMSILLISYSPISGGAEQAAGSIATLFIILAALVVATAMVNGIFVAAASVGRAGEALSFEAAYGYARRKLRPLVGITVLWYLLWALTFILASVVTMIFFGKEGFDTGFGYMLAAFTVLLRVFTAFIHEAVMFEGSGVLGAFSRSIELLKKDAAMVAVVVVTVQAASYAAAAIMPVNFVWATVAVGIFIVPFEAIAEVLMYLYIRTRGEGRELEEIVGGLEMATKAPPRGRLH